MEQDTTTVREESPKPLTRDDVDRAFDLVGEALGVIRGGMNAVPLSKREPCELLVTYARDNLSTAHSLLCSALCDVKQDWRK